MKSVKPTHPVSTGTRADLPAFKASTGPSPIYVPSMMGSKNKIKTELVA